MPSYSVGDDKHKPSLVCGGVAPSTVSGTVTNVVSAKGFAFATFRLGNVFIPARVHAALGKPTKGRKVSLQVKKSDRGWIALEPPPLSRVSWGDWQIGQHQVSIPDTRPGSEHTVSFACFECGNFIVEGSNIHKIKQAAVWTQNTTALDETVKLGKQFYNSFKKTTAHGVHCMKCNKSVGAMYSKPYYLSEPDTPFPCLKLYLTGERDNAVYNDLVLISESRQRAEYYTSRLTTLYDGSFYFDSSNASIQMRTTQHTFDLKKQIEAERKMRETAELRAKAAAEEVQSHESSAAKEKKLREKAQKNANALAAKYAAMRNKDSVRLWSFAEAPGKFQNYDQSLNAKVNATYNPRDPAKSASIRWSERGFNYEINWVRLVQVNLDTGKKRPIKYTVSTSWKGGASVSKPWLSPPQNLPNGVKLHTIRASDLDQSETRELAEFNFAFAQLQKLVTRRERITVQQVDVYESPAVESSYEMKKRSMKNSREIWVFHGTSNLSAVASIMSGGFKVGGRSADVPVANGSAYGHGVYTATGPNTPMGYANAGNAGNRVILAKALEGVKGRQEVDDCWAPKDDWLVFKTGEQLIPKYVVHFESE